MNLSGEWKGRIDKGSIKTLRNNGKVSATSVNSVRVFVRAVQYTENWGKTLTLLSLKRDGISRAP